MEQNSGNKSSGTLYTFVDGQGLSTIRPLPEDILKQETETSAEAWVTLAGLLDRGPLAVVWHDGRGCVRTDFDTILQLQGDTILSRTYQQGKVVSEGGHVEPGRLCWNDTWTRERSSVTHWPFMDTLLDYLQQRVTA